MSFEAAVVISLTLLIGVVVIMTARLVAGRRSAEDEACRREASARGWSFETASKGHDRIRQWKGTTDGISWKAESRWSARRRGHGRQQQRMRWWADTLRGPAGPVLLIGVPEGVDVPSLEVASGDGMLARLARKVTGLVFDRVLDDYFGVEAGRLVDAAALKRVDGPLPPGYVVMAADPAEAGRVLFGGMSQAVHAASGDLKPEDPEGSRPWLLLLPRRISIARMDALASTAELERIARAGAALLRRT